MNIEKNNLDTLNAELTISLQKEDYTPRVDKALKEYRKRTQLPGFRPGHVPMTLIQQRFGKSILAEEINTVLQGAIYKYIQENKIEILGSPMPKKDNGEVGNWDDPNEFRFTYELALAPEVSVALNKNQSFVYHKVNVDDIIIDRHSKDLARRYGKMSDPEMSSEEHMLMAELHEINETGEIIEGGIFNKTTVSIEYVPDADTKKQLIGLKIGDSVVIDAMNLNNNHEDLAKMLGITHHQVHHLHNKFKLTVTEVKHLEPHEFNQELFDKIYPAGEVTSIEGMKEKVLSELEQMFTRDADWLFKREFALEISKRTNFNLPDEFLKRWIVSTNEKPVTLEQVEYEYPVYSGQLRWQLIENAILKQYEIKVSPDEALNHVKSVLRDRYTQYGLPIGDDELTEMAKKPLTNKEELKNIYDFLYEEKMIQLVKELCHLEEKMLSLEEFTHRAQH